MFKLPTVLVIVLTLLLTEASAAHGAERSLWSFNGYGTFGMVHSNEDRADYLATPLTSEGPGRSGSTTHELDSRMGVQVGAYPTPRLSAVVQAVVEQGFGGDYEAVIEWANVRYELSPALSVRAGRIEVDSFLMSDHRNVGFSIPWVRPPAEVYGRIPVTSSDGVDVAYQARLGDVRYTAHASMGTDDTAGADTAGRMLSSTVEWRDLALRAIYMDVDLELEQVSSLFDAVASLGPEGAAVARRYDPADNPMTMVALSARYAPGRSFLLGEWAGIRSDSVLGGASAWYLSGGHRFGDVTPYLTYARSQRESSSSVAGLSAEGYPPELAALAMGLNQALNGIRNATPVQQTWTIGARWDLARNVDMKIQYDRIDVDDDSPGTFGNMRPGYLSSGAELFSLAVDFVL